MILVLTTMFCSGSARPAPADRDRNVLLITLDTTRADRLGCYGYGKAGTPRLDALAAGGIRFADAYSPVPLTLPAHCSIFTGSTPPVHGVRNNGSYELPPEAVTLAERLRADGFLTAAFVGSFTVDSRFGLAQGFDSYDDTFRSDEFMKNFRSERRGDEVVRAFERWLEAAGEARFFGWVHFYDPHLPYDPPPPFRESFAGRPYDGEIAFMDSCVGQVLDNLERKGILDKTLVVVAGDHGEALGEKGEIDHGLFVYQPTLRVPLILWAKGRLPAGTTVARAVSLIDIVPTVLEFLGLPRDKSLEGRSLLPLATRPRGEDPHIYFESLYPFENFGWAELRGIVEGRWKYIQAPRPELYNLAADPAEETNLAAVESARAGNMKKALGGFLERSVSAIRGTIRKTPSTEELERLRSLGYLSGGPSRQAADKIPPDPKDKTGDYRLYFQGNLYETQGRFEKAADCYRKVLDSNPGVAWNYVNLGFLFMKMDKVAEAVEIMERAARRLPDSPVVLARLMTFYSRAGRFEDAEAAGEALLKIEPRHFDALFLLGSLAARRSDWPAAVAYYERALAIEPENGTLRQRHSAALAAAGKSK